MTQVVQQPYNLFAQQKLAGYPTAEQQKKQAPAADAATAVAGDVPKTTPVVRNVVQRQVPVINRDSSTAGMDYLNSLYTDPREEDRLRKASVANQRILAVGDALRQIGNIYHTVKGAPSQTFNSPVQEEYARYQQAKSVRDAANQRYYSYQQAKAAQDAAQRKWEEDQTYKNNMLKHYQDQDRRLWERDAETARKNAFLERLKEKEFDLKKAFNEGRISIAEYNAQTSRIRAMRTGANSGSGGTKGDNLAGRIVEESRTYTDDGKTATITKKWTNTNTGAGGSKTTTKKNTGVKWGGTSSSKGSDKKKTGVKWNK